MAAKKMSPELKEKMSLVATAMRELERNHLSWIADAAADEFRDRLRKTEAEIMRHTFFADRPEENNLENPYEKRTRHEMRQRLEENRTAYMSILKFLRAIQEALMQFSAEEFAEGMRDFWKKGGKL